MGHCVQSATVKGPCQQCGGYAEKMHTPIFARGTYCPKCCPVCSAKPEQSSAPAPPPRGLVSRPPQRASTPARTGSQWLDAGWGHRPDDPWIHDRDRHAPEPWVPRRPDWLRNVRARLN